ncbi:hypothetical protein [Oceanobacter mangrovi]|uniref:hypothetical protein n=1 Tax=Oceanobacter mangrovi TaxID=2862510 RepID=UPI001C8E4ECB|nr:hypothetical protein [Oceanobacter mangrovi]
MTVPKIARWLLGWLALTALLLWLSWQQAINTAADSLQQQLQQQLLPQIIADEGYRLNQYSQDQTLLSHINHDLQQLQFDGTLPLLQSCQLRLYSLGDGKPVENTADRHFTLQRTTTDGVQDFPFALSCQPHPGVWLGSQSLLAGLALLLISWLPVPLGQSQRHWYEKLLHRGEPGRLARQYARQLSQLDQHSQSLLELLLQHSQQPLAELLMLLAQAEPDKVDGQWLDIALQQGESPTDALRIASAADSLRFDPQQRLVSIHGLTIQLPVTPYLYYLWYAQRRQSDEQLGWFTNPATNRPDIEQGRQLSELMARYGGHGKAINDLVASGLKSKTLDQNRSKIKDELTSRLGEQLAGHYLFDTERDLQSGRSRYRLSLPGTAVEITESSPASLESTLKDHVNQ